MAQEPRTLFSPLLQTDHPLTIEPTLDSADSNPKKITEEDGAIVESLKTEEFIVSWDSLEDAVTYNLYVSVSPKRNSNIVQKDIATNYTTWVPPLFTEVITYYFWVAWVDEDGVETYITDDPASLQTRIHQEAFAENPLPTSCLMLPETDTLNCEIKQALEYIRSGNELQSAISGEKALLFLRRHASDLPWGIPCACNDSADKQNNPDYNGRGRCKLCFGTGIYGGFYPAIPVTIRYESAPNQNYVRTKQGYQLEHQFNTYMIWDPRVRTGDLIVRKADGSRYIVNNVKETSSRAIRLHQEFDITQVEKTSILMEVTDTQIQELTDKASAPGVLMDGFKLFG